MYLKGDLARHKGSEERIIKLITKAYYLYFNFQTQRSPSVAKLKMYYQCSDLCIIWFQKIILLK